MPDPASDEYSLTEEDSPPSKPVRRRKAVPAEGEAPALQTDSGENAAPRKKTGKSARAAAGKPKAEPMPRHLSLGKRLRRWFLRLVLGVAALYIGLILLFSFVPPATNIYQMQESSRLGGIKRDWVPWEEIAPVMGRSAVAAEDANFCRHWGFDMAAIRDAINTGSNRGASTISQQVAKNVFLWQGRSWLRKAMEAALTPGIELIWSKQRILEVYLNIAEFDEGVFGVEAAAQHYFGVSARGLTALQAARLAAILPDPKNRSASNPSDFVRKRTRAIISGAETIKADGRARCFE